MTDIELQKLVNKYNRYKTHGEEIGYKDFLLLFDELLSRHENK